LPQLGHLQVKALRFFKSWNPGQCCGVVMIRLLSWNYFSWHFFAILFSA
jgi:hypothetical protein